MYIYKAHIQNIRSIDKFDLEFELGKEKGWHVIIGDNGSGKSTIIRSIALCLVGPDEAPASREDWSKWIRHGSESGTIRLDVSMNDTFDKRSGSGRTVEKNLIPAIIQINKLEDSTVKLQIPKNGRPFPHDYLWGTGDGWFSASFGPYRRFTGGDKDYEKLFYSHKKLAPHLTAFDESIALTECLSWLRDLHVKQLEKKITDPYLNDLVTFINECGLLPHGTKIETIDSEAVYFKDGNDCIVPLVQMSDGYRSILSMTFELFRLMTNCYEPKQIFEHIRKGNMIVDLPGVVLIDEVDAHLHPAWQKRIGSWFVKCFPKIQFIVTTHSPLICHAAETGSVWRLSTPGSDIPSGRVQGTELQRLIYGNILEALDTELFGEDVTQSASAQEKLSRLAQLNVKSTKGALTDLEKKEIQELRRLLPTSVDKELATKE